MYFVHSLVLSQLLLVSVTAFSVTLNESYEFGIISFPYQRRKKYIPTAKKIPAVDPILKCYSSGIPGFQMEIISFWPCRIPQGAMLF